VRSVRKLSGEEYSQPASRLASLSCLETESKMATCSTEIAATRSMNHVAALGNSALTLRLSSAHGNSRTWERERRRRTRASAEMRTR
jgi:hypothetical protein